MTRLPRRNNAAELDAFEQVCLRLGGFTDHAFDFEYADGYLTALATLPLWPPPADWLIDFAGDAFDRTFADPDDRAQALRALDLRLKVLRDELGVEALSDAPDLLRLYPLVAEPQPPQGEQAAIALGERWAAGCQMGLRFLESQVAMPVEGELLDEYRRLQGVVHRLSAEAAAALPDDADRDDLLTDALYALQVIRLWALDTLPAIATRRVAKGPGRNDPCPCGSGRKYKKCHGA